MTSRPDINELRRMIDGCAVDELEAELTRWWVDQPGMLAEVLLAVAEVCGPQAGARLWTRFRPLVVRPDETSIAHVRALAIRVRAVDHFDGPEAGDELLHARTSTLHEHWSGFAWLMIGRSRLVGGDLDAAVAALGRAVEGGMRGVKWYLVEALNEMTFCQLRLGYTTMAFEYARASLIQSYERGDLDDAAFLRALATVSTLMGQMDYLVDMQTSVATRARADRRYLQAAGAEQTAAVALAIIGNTERACVAFERAAEDSLALGRPDDLAVALRCRLLAAVHRGRGRRAALAEVMKQGPNQSAAAALDDALANPPRPQSFLRFVRTVAGAESDGNCEARQTLLTAGVVVATILQERGHSSACVLDLYRLAVDGAAPSEWHGAIALEGLVSARTPDTLNDIASRCTAVLERLSSPFVRFRVLTGLAHILSEQGRVVDAVARCDEAIVLWRRIMNGLYERSSKIRWLERGADCIDLAVELATRPEGWPDEQSRLRHLMTAAELAKARLMTDGVERGDVVPGPFLIAELGARGTDVYRQVVREFPGWFELLALQSAYQFDGAVSWTYDEAGWGPSVRQLDLGPLVTSLRMPWTAERHLLASVEPVSFDDPDVLVDHDLIRDLTSATS